MFSRQPSIKFMTFPDLIDVIPKPYQARKFMPEWYKRLTPNTLSDDGYETPTLKRCPPFLDAMSAGWIIPAPADVWVKIQDDGSGVSWKTEFDHNVLEAHGQHQIKGHPKCPTVALKVLNYWITKTPPGWSTLFTPPLNRESKYYELLSGIVETDKHFEFVNFPGFLKAREGSFKIPRGTPLMQAIPFKRDFDKDAVCRELNSKEMAEYNLQRKKRGSHTSLYRETQWEKK